MLKKQMDKDAAKQKAKDEARAGKRGIAIGNAGEMLDRKKQRFDLTQSSMDVDGDFEDIKKVEDQDPRFTSAYKLLLNKRLLDSG